MSVKGSSSKEPDRASPMSGALHKDLKTHLPDTYSGKRSELETFITHCELFIGFNSTRFVSDTEKVLWTTALLEGAAFNWIEPFIKDFMENKTDLGQCSTAMTKDTLTIFQTWKGFKKCIRRVFGDIDAERTAVRSIQNLRQKGSAANYTAEFQQHQAKTKWNDEALCAQYYRGLKDGVKDEMCRSDKPDDLKEMIDLAVKIDNRLYERNLEKRGHYDMGQKKGKHGKHPRHRDRGDPMDLDAMSQKKRKPSKEEMDRRKRDGLCYDCGLPGHRASSHRSNGKKLKGGKKQANVIGRKGYNGPDERDDTKARCISVLEREPETPPPSSPDSLPALDSPSPTEVEPTSSGDLWILPRLGETWMVKERTGEETEIGTRVWQRLSGANGHAEYDELGPVYWGGPKTGEIWEVRYRDSQRIGWKQVSGNGAYMQRLDRYTGPYYGTIPKDGELWESLTVGIRARIYRSVDNEDLFYREKTPKDDDTTLKSGHVFRVMNKQGRHITWMNVLTGATHQGVSDTYALELNKTGDAGHLEITVIINGGPTLRAMVDSGAMGNYIDPAVVSAHDICTRVKEESYSLVMADGGQASYRDGTVDIETFPLAMLGGEHMEEIVLDVTELGKHEIILGMPWIKKHNPIIDWKKGTLDLTRCKCQSSVPGNDDPWYLTKKEKQQDAREACAASKEQSEHLAQGSLPTSTVEASDDIRIKIYGDFAELFKEKVGHDALPEHAPWDCEIRMKEGTVPPSNTIYPMNQEDLRTLKEHIDKNVTKGFFRESRSPYSSPAFFVPKPNGGRRLVIDYRKLNEVTVKDRYAIPLPDELRDRLQGAKIFTKLDLRGAFNLIRMKEGEEEKTAFRTRYGHYEYTVMPMGLVNAPAVFMRRMNNVLRPYLDKICVCYLDDILVYSRDVRQHMQDVRDILTALREAKLLLEPEKCRFHVTSVTFLGYIITTEGIKMDPRKIQTILDWGQPKSVKDVQSFLGFANFYRRFIKGYSAIAIPLTQLTHKDTEFEWTSQVQDAFDRLKQAFTSAPVLISFNPEREIQVETDASDYAMGAVLSQKNDQGR
jgi:hypothetical protein